MTLWSNRISACCDRRQCCRRVLIDYSAHIDTHTRTPIYTRICVRACVRAISIHFSISFIIVLKITSVYLLLLNRFLPFEYCEVISALYFHISSSIIYRAYTNAHTRAHTHTRSRAHPHGHIHMHIHSLTHTSIGA